MLTKTALLVVFVLVVRCGDDAVANEVMFDNILASSLELTSRVALTSSIVVAALISYSNYIT